VSVNVRRNLAVTLTPAGGTNPLKLRVSTSASPKIGSALTISFAAYGGVAPYAYSVVAGSLPTGMGAVNSGTGLSTGTPTVAGTFTFTAQVQDSASTVFKVTTTVTVAHLLVGTTITPSASEKNVAFSYQFGVSGATGAVTWAIASGTQPTGLTMSAGGILSGTPTSAAGSYNFVVTATDAGSGDVLSIPITMQLQAQLSVAFTQLGLVTSQPTFLPPIYIGVPYSTGVTVTGGVPPYRFNDGNGNLFLAEMAVDSKTGLVSGTNVDAVARGYLVGLAAQVGVTDAVGAFALTPAGNMAFFLAQNRIQAQNNGTNVSGALGSDTYNFVGASSVTFSSGLLTITYTASSLSAQPLSTDLTAIAALTGTGPLNRSGVGTWALGGTLFANGTIGGSAAIDWTKGSQQTATLTASTLSTLAFTAPTAANVFLTLAVTQASGGAGTVAFPGTVQSAPGQITQIFTSANLVTKFVFFYDGTNYWLISSALIFGNPNFGNAYLYAGNVSSIGAAVGKSGTGTYVTWNLSGGGVETNFINQSASATGGWDWRKSDGTTITLIAALDVKGQWKGANYGAAPNNLGVVGATAAIDWTVSHQAKFQQTNGTACTVTFSANPAQPCFLDVTAQGSAAGAGGAITWPAVKGTAMTGTGVTTAKFSNYLLWWDGTNYWVINQQINA
jgi:hypothetical protein